MRSRNSTFLNRVRREMTGNVKRMDKDRDMEKGIRIKL
jgi:hypothetical protein